MEQKVSDILETVLSTLSLKGSFDVEEKEDGVFVSIDLEEPGRLIGHQGQTLQALQLIVNQIILRQVQEPKRIIIDVSGWRQTKEEELAHKARVWAKQVIDNKENIELPPMPAWQRRIVHMTINQTEGARSESIGEGIDRHLVISPAEKNPA